MIDADDFGLGDWTLVESGEQAMLAQVTRAEKPARPIVFLAWAPHPMNTAHELTYLSGGDAYFGPDYGGADGLDAGAHRLGGGLPERGEVLRGPRLRRRHGEPDDGPDPRRRREARAPRGIKENPAGSTAGSPTSPPPASPPPAVKPRSASDRLRTRPWPHTGTNSVRARLSGWSARAKPCDARRCIGEPERSLRASGGRSRHPK